MSNNRTFVKLFKHNPEPSDGSFEGYSEDVKMDIGKQINLYMTDYMTRTKREVVAIKQITYLNYHMSLTVEALVVFERFRQFDDKDLGMAGML
tara:strand:+ start:690 stop:968 length:279 start_codon:yes stop_codon:yes gene_type:complete